MRHTKNRAFALLMIVGGLIIIVSAVAWSFFSKPSAIQDVSLRSVQTSLSELERVDLATAKRAFDNNQAVFIDVRGAQFYEESHIQGALSIPENEVELRKSELDPSWWIITYCT